MTPPARAREVFQAALDVPPDERPCFLDAACAGDAAVRAEVESLLAQDEHAEREGFLAPPGTPPARPAGGDAGRWVGRRLGPYEVRRHLADGGMGAVYLAERWRDYRQQVAVKLLRAGLGLDDFLARFHAERQALAGLQHPNIAHLLDGGTSDDGVPYLVLEYVDGQPLDRFCDARHLTVRQRLEVLLPICAAVQHAHEHGIVHRDLKPANVLVTADATPKVMDFGLAKQLAVGSDGTRVEAQTGTGIILGTPGYMAPEQGAGQAKAIGPATDVYALGAILYHLLTGRPPFRADSPMQTVLQGLTEEPVPPHRLHLGLPRDVETICLKCLHRDPRRRYASARELADDLGRFLRGEPIRARPAGPAERLLKWTKRRPATAALLLCLALLVAGGVAAAAEYLQRERLLRQETEKSALLARRYQYAADMSLAAEVWHKGQSERARDLLAGMRPGPGQPDLRDFAYCYLWRLCGSDLLLRGHTGTVSCLAFSPDGTLLASGSLDHTVKLWDTATWDERCTLHGHEGGITGLAFTPDGSRLATTARDGTLRLWDCGTGREEARSGPQGCALRGVACAPDGQTLATASDDLTLKLWDARTCRELDALRPQEGALPGRSQSLACLAFAPDGKTLAAGSWNTGTIGFWDVSSHTLRAALLADHETLPYFVAYAPDGRTIAAPYRNTSVRLVDPHDLQTRRTLEGHTGSIYTVCFGPGGKLLATAGLDGTARVWDVDSGRERQTLRGYAGRVAAVAFSPDGRTLASGGDDRVIHLHDPATGQARRRPTVGPSGTGPAWLEEAGEHARLDTNHLGVGWTGFTLAGDTLGVVAGRSIAFYDPATGQKRLDFLNKTGNLMTAAFSPDGHTLATGGSEKTVALWDVATGERRAVLEGHTLGVYALAFSPDGRSLASGAGMEARPGEVKLWDVAGRRERASLEGPAGSVRSLAFAPDGRLLAAGSGDGGVYLWDPATGRLLHRLAGHTETVHALAFSPDGATLASGGADATVRLWDLAGPRERLALHGHVGPVFGLAFSPDGRTLASGGQDGAVKLWGTVIDRELATLQGHTTRVNSLAFAPDGTVLASGGFDAAVNLWYAPRPDE
jgi:WD40 repeat protein